LLWKYGAVPLIPCSPGVSSLFQSSVGGAPPTNPVNSARPGSELVRWRNLELWFPVRPIDRDGWQSDSLLRDTDVVTAWSDKRLSAADNRD